MHVQVRKGADYWSASRDGRKGSEDYVNGRTYLHVHLGICVNEVHPVNPTYWCVGFYRSGEGPNQAWSNRSNILELVDVPKSSEETRHCRMQQAVLVDAVQVVQDPKQVGSKVVASLVRLQPLDDCLRVWMPTPDLEQSAARGGSSSLLRLMESSTADTGSALPILIPEDGEFRAMRDVLRERLRVSSGQRIGQVV